MQVSRTTTETAYLQMAADGLIVARERSGYYVTGVVGRENQPIQTKSENNSPDNEKMKYLQLEDIAN